MSITITDSTGDIIPTGMPYSNRLNSLNTFEARSVLSNPDSALINAHYSNQVDYGRYGPFASQTKTISVCSDAFGKILSFLTPNELACSESVCKNWNQFIPGQWKRQCQIQLGIDPKTDPKSYLPEKCTSYKDGFRLMSSSIIDGSVWRRYIGDVGPVPPIPEAISLKKWTEPDPCDAATTIGAEYIWIYIPPYIETDAESFSLDKPDNPNDPEAPKLIKTGLMKKLFGKIGFNTKSKNLKAPVTFNNIVEIFKRPKTGNPSTCAFVWHKIVEQHGNTRIPAGWVCMKKHPVGNSLTFVQQQALANEKGVAISSLLHRIIFNFMEQTRSNTPNVYPDGEDPYSIVRTSTLIQDEAGNNWPSDCGAGGPFGLRVTHRIFDYDYVGVSVVLPAEVEAIGP